MPAYLDPTRGVMLSIYAQRPNTVERIEKGELVGYIIIVVGVIGGGLALYQLFYLATVRGRVRNQLKFQNDPVPDNPLGPRAGDVQGRRAESSNRTPRSSSCASPRPCSRKCRSWSVSNRSCG